MSAVDLDQRTGAWARQLEEREARRSQVTIAAARGLLARRLGIPAGTLENLRRGRLKGVRAWVAEKLRNAVVRELQHEIKALEDELALVLAVGRGDRPLAVQEIEATLIRMRSLLREGGPSALAASSGTADTGPLCEEE